MNTFKWAFIFPIFALLWTGGCSGKPTRQEITEVHELPEARRVMPSVLSTAQRFGVLEAIQEGMGGALPPAPAMTAPTDPAGQPAREPSAIRWEAPESWEQTGERPMRLATYLPEGTGSVECVVSILAGEAGGVLPNLNRWRRQLGLPPLGEADKDSLASMEVLNSTAVYMECIGVPPGTGESGDTEYMLLGVVCPLSGYTLFVKMTGPTEEVAREKDRFLAFLESLHFEETLEP